VPAAVPLFSSPCSDLSLSLSLDSTDREDCFPLVRDRECETMKEMRGGSA
jgi:hypothetical protein